MDPKQNLINGVLLIKSNIINNSKGDIYHILKNVDLGFVGFGEVYISTIFKNEIKAWKKHLKMTCNLLVPFGEVKFVLIDMREDSDTFNLINEFFISPENYFRLVIPPGVWFGFTGLSDNNFIVNVSDITHDPLEQINISRLEYNLIYNW